VTAPPTQQPSRTPTTPPTVQSRVTVYSTRAHCTSHQDPNGYATLAWSSVGGTQVYIQHGIDAVSSTDARAGGGRGPFPYNGSATMPFNCASINNDYYRLDVYGIESHGGSVVYVPYNT
jgi:hypothetical protein